MRRVSVSVAILAAAAGLSSGLAAGGSNGKPQLRVVSLKPFEVAGTGFHRGESVRVTARAEDNVSTRTDIADAAGRIVVRFRSLRLAACPTYMVAARGDAGSTAGLRSVPRPCGPDQ